MPATARLTQAHSHAGGQAGAKAKLYNPRHPERTLLDQTIAEHFETWFELASAGQFDGQGAPPKPYVRLAFRKYLECGIFAHGFARAWCDDCGYDYFVAYSCKGRGVCPSCKTRRMVETAAHLCDHGAVAFIHRFGSSLNGHVHFRVCALDGVFEEMLGVEDTDAQSSPPGIVFHPASAIDETAVAQVQATLQKRILRAFVGRGLLQSCDAKDMLASRVRQLMRSGRPPIAAFASQKPTDFGTRRHGPNGWPR